MKVNDELAKRDEYLRNNTVVFINPTDERGHNEFAICVATDPVFWLGTCSTHDEALEFCDAHGLEVVE